MTMCFGLWYMLYDIPYSPLFASYLLLFSLNLHILIVGDKVGRSVTGPTTGELDGGADGNVGAPFATDPVMVNVHGVMHVPYGHST